MVLQLFSRQRQTLQSEIDFIIGNIIKLARPCFFSLKHYKYIFKTIFYFISGIFPLTPLLRVSNLLFLDLLTSKQFKD